MCVCVYTVLRGFRDLCNYPNSHDTEQFTKHVLELGCVAHSELLSVVPLIRELSALGLEVVIWLVQRPLEHLDSSARCGYHLQGPIRAWSPTAGVLAGEVACTM